MTISNKIIKEYKSEINSTELFLSAQAGDLGSRNKIVSNNLKLVYKTADKYVGSSSDIEDLFSSGVVGLIKAIEMFDVERGSAFSTYASWWIEDSIRREFHKNSTIVHIPSGVSRNSSKVKNAREFLKKELGKEPTNLEIASHVGIDASLVSSLLIASNVRNNRNHFSQYNGEFDNEVSFMDTFESDVDFEKEVENDRVIQKVMSCLSEKEAYVVAKKTGLDGEGEETFESIASEMNLSKQRIQQIYTGAIKKMNQKYA